MQAGLVAGIIFLLLNLFLTQVFSPGFSPSMMVRYFASIVLGDSILPAANNPLTWRAYLAMGLLHFALAVCFACIVAFIVHRWGLVLSVLVGAGLGLCLYAINIYSLTIVVPHFYGLQSPFFLGTHVIFGAMVGGIYEALEFEVFLADDGSLLTTEPPVKS